MTTIPGVRCTTIFSCPPGVPTGLAATVEHGDVVLLVELAGVPFCQVVLALDAASGLSLQLASAVMDARRSNLIEGGAP